MLQRTRLFLLAACALAIAPSSASAHFVWIVAGGQSPDGKVHVYFSESASPDDPDLLDRLASVKVHQAAPGRVIELSLTKGEASLVATPALAIPSTLFLSHAYGVIARGGDTFLLKYHAKTYSSDRPQTWIGAAPSHALPFEIVPRLEGDQTVFLVLWHGKPLEKVEVTITGGGVEKLEGTTDQRGEFAAELPLGRQYSVRARHTENQSGEYDGKDYASIRHYSTLALQLPKAVAGAELPVLDPPVTSFGGAVSGDFLYVAGGHFGAPHHYSEPGQSGRFARLNLKQPVSWEELPSLPKRTGLALVAHRGRVYRIGGFVAKNKENEDQVLESTADVAEYDPASNRWTDLTPLPRGRSSHDAAVLGNDVYVVGGWTLSGGGDTTWHDTMLVADLAQRPLVWNEVSTPFRRRALSIAAWRGKLVVVGGMQESGGPITATAVYDPATRTWSDGPSIQGSPMDGFGSSTFAVGDELYVSTMSGKLQRLSADGKQWIVVAQLAFPRFFHRMLPADESQLVIVGGASMRSGKVRELELWSPADVR